MRFTNMNIMKYFDIAAVSLLVVGGLNWGMVGFFGFDLVARLIAGVPMVSTVIYCLVGCAAIYEAVQFRTIARRWECRWAMPEAKGSTA